MAIVKGPMLSTWASGKIGNGIIFRDAIKYEKFVVQGCNIYRKEPTEAQKRINDEFGKRVNAWKIATENLEE